MKKVSNNNLLALQKKHSQILHSKKDSRHLDKSSEEAKSPIRTQDISNTAESELNDKVELSVDGGKHRNTPGFKDDKTIHEISADLEDSCIYSMRARGTTNEMMDI